MLTWHFIIINLGHVDINLVLFILPFAMSAFSVSDVTAGLKQEAFFRIGTKSGKNKMYGLK